MLFGRPSHADQFAERPWLLNEAPNNARASEFGLTLDEYRKVHAAAVAEAAAERAHAANMREIANVKGGIRVARHQAHQVRTLADSGTLANRKRLLDAEYEVEHREERLRYMIRGLPRSAQREHLADVGIDL